MTVMRTHSSTGQGAVSDFTCLGNTATFSAVVEVKRKHRMKKAGLSHDKAHSYQSLVSV